MLTGSIYFYNAYLNGRSVENPEKKMLYNETLYNIAGSFFNIWRMLYIV